jgi:hypothetical protein
MDLFLNDVPRSVVEVYQQFTVLAASIVRALHIIVWFYLWYGMQACFLPVNYNHKRWPEASVFHSNPGPADLLVLNIAGMTTTRLASGMRLSHIPRADCANILLVMFAL